MVAKPSRLRLHGTVRPELQCLVFWRPVHPSLKNHGYAPVPEETRDNQRGAGHARFGAPQDRPSRRNRDLHRMMAGTTWHRRSSTLPTTQPEVIDRRVVAILFDDQDFVRSVNTYGLEDGRIIDLETNTTPTFGRELTIHRAGLWQYRRSTPKSSWTAIKQRLSIASRRRLSGGLRRLAHCQPSERGSSHSERGKHRDVDCRPTDSCHQRAGGEGRDGHHAEYEKVVQIPESRARSSGRCASASIAVAPMKPEVPADPQAAPVRVLKCRKLMPEMAMIQQSVKRRADRSAMIFDGTITGDEITR